jgi:hypothetical protein
MMEALRFSETSVLTRATTRSNPEDGILHSHRHENIKFYKIHNVSEWNSDAKRIRKREADNKIVIIVQR